MHTLNIKYPSSHKKCQYLLVLYYLTFLRCSSYVFTNLYDTRLLNQNTHAHAKSGILMIPAKYMHAWNWAPVRCVTRGGAKTLCLPSWLISLLEPIFVHACVYFAGIANIRDYLQSSTSPKTIYSERRKCWETFILKVQAIQLLLPPLTKKYHAHPQPTLEYLLHKQWALQW